MSPESPESLEHEALEAAREETSKCTDICFSPAFPTQLAIVIALSASCIFFVWTFIAYYMRGGFAAQRLRQQPNESFCCLDVLNALPINTDQDPCVDFRDYICSNNSRFAKGLLPRWSRLSIAEALVESRHYRWAWAGLVLNQLYDSCKHTIPNPVLFTRKLTHAILKTSIISKNASAAEFLEWMALLSIQLKTPSVITVEIWKTPATLGCPPGAQVNVLYNRASVYRLTKNCTKCTDMFLKAFNKVLGANVSKFQLLQFQSRQAMSEAPASTKCDCNRSVLLDILPEIGAWNNLAKEYAKSNFSEISAVCYSSRRNLRRIFESVSDPRNSSTSIAIAALHAVALAHKLIVKKEVHFNASMLTCLCEDYLAWFPNVWTLLFEQVSTCPVRDNQVREVFSRVRDAVVSLMAKLNNPERNNLADITATVRGMRLFLPSDAVVSDLDIPYITDNFGIGYVNMRLIEYAIHRQRQVMGQPTVNLLKDPAVAGDEYLAVSPIAYEHLDITHSEGLLLNTPVVGTFIAHAIWKYVILKARWNESILPKLSEFYRCPLTFEGAKNSSSYQKVIELAFVLPTLLTSIKSSEWHARHLSDWYGEGHLSDLLDASYSRLFYLRLGNTMCDEYFNWGEAINTVVQHMRDFSRAFVCHDYHSSPNPPLKSKITNCKIPIGFSRQ